MRICAVIPAYNHYVRLPEIIAAFRAQDVPVYVVDDGNREEIRRHLRKLHDPEQGVSVLRLEKNSGKGAAVLSGADRAYRDGYTHFFQIDADGQHDIAAVGRAMRVASSHPESVVSGQAVYDRTAPLGRRMGRWITHIWVWIETLSFCIKDSMCGFRIYPIEAVRRVQAGARLGRRMDFDTDILVRLCWAGVPILNFPVSVRYDPENVSNFRAFKDNCAISWMHTRLVFTAILRRFKSLLCRCSKPRTLKWAEFSERGIYWGMKSLALICRWTPRFLQNLLLFPVILYFFLTGRKQREASYDYLGLVLPHRPGLLDGLRHFMNFGRRALDVFLAWTGGVDKSRLRIVTPEAFEALGQSESGGLLLISHYGNVEITRPLLDTQFQDRLMVLVHTLHAEKYNRLLAEGNEGQPKNMMQVTDFGVETIFKLQDAIEKGMWVAIAGDRTPVKNDKAVTRVPFLGKDAAFPDGPWILASLLQCPVYTLYCVRDGTAYNAHLELFSKCITLPRKQRKPLLQEMISRYAAVLASHCRKDPYQWYNFYDFWA